MNQATGGSLAPETAATHVLWQGEFLTRQFRLVSVVNPEPMPGEAPATMRIEDVTPIEHLGDDEPESVQAIGVLPNIEGVTAAELLGWMAGQIYQAGLVRGRRAPLDAVEKLRNESPHAVSDEVIHVLGLQGMPILTTLQFLAGKMPDHVKQLVQVTKVGELYGVAIHLPGHPPIPVGHKQPEGPAADLAMRTANALASLLVPVTPEPAAETVAEPGSNS